jgi:hypothetical protein
MGDQTQFPELVALLTREQIHQFLRLPGKPKVLKGELAQALLALIEADTIARERFFETFKSELAVGPWEVEATLHCTPTERKRWTADGKLPILEYRTFHKVARDIPYPVYERRLISTLSQETLERWRAEHQNLVQLRRKTGVRKALESRNAHQQSRQTFQQQWQAIVATWSEHGSPELAAALQLAYWTVWTSRWAKENQLKQQHAIKHHDKYERQITAWYGRKNKAVQLLSKTPYARLSFYRPEEPDKISLFLCDEHYEMKREGYYETKWDFYADWGPEVRRCPKCEYSEQHDFYSLYFLELRSDAFPELCFAFHTPYPIGKAFWPAPQKLPQVEHIEQDGIFRFGRSLLDGEKIIYRENDVLARFEGAFAEAQKFFGQSPAL